jgi:hypothetical protein
MARAELIRACLDQDKQQVTHRNDRNSLWVQVGRSQKR